MAKPKDQSRATKNDGATVGYEAQLWQMADALRGSMDAAEYKHVVLGLIFLKYISDAFEEQHARLEAEKSKGADPEDPEEYCAQNIFWVPPEARWAHLKVQARQPTIGQLVDEAMAGIERDNPALKNVLPGLRTGRDSGGVGAVPLPELIDVNPPRSLRKGEITPYLDMANMPTRGHAPDEVIDRPFGSGMRFMNGDTLVARITPCLENGKTAFVDFLKEGEVGWGSTEYIVLRPKPPLPEEFAYCLARSDGFREFAIQSMTGSSGRQRVPADSLSHYMLAAPAEQIAARFGSFARPLFARASAAAHESRTLVALRDTLLPKLISGELRVKDAEKFIGRTV